MKSSAYLVKFQIGPVQEFIAQARSTRDLWSGSYLLSWLVAAGIREALNAGGPDCIIYPDISEQPLVKGWSPERFPKDIPAENARRLLTPNLPNVFLAKMPCHVAAESAAKAVETVFSLSETSEWGRIVEAARSFLGISSSHDDRIGRRWRDQTERLWQVTWQIFPMLCDTELAEARKTLPIFGEPSGDHWDANYQLASHRLDGRRNLRDFSAWPGVPLVHKDHFSGKEEVIADRGWLDNLRCEKPQARFLFRANDELGAANLIKRVWHRAYLADAKGIALAKGAFASVPDVAAAPWRKELEKRIPEGADGAGRAWEDFVLSVRGAKESLEPEIYNSLPTDNDPEKWIGRAGLAVFSESTWQTAGGLASAEPAAAVRASLARLAAITGMGEPCRYFAVIAMDGDFMGAWVSGEMTGGTTEKGHREFSALLSGFALESARKIVDKHRGELIYAGGDDVLALVPATAAVACARALTAGFGGLAHRGVPLTASVGIAIGHIKEPLQDMVEAARDAEGRAKRFRERKNAMSVTLFKRSGKMVRWEAGNESKAFALLELFQTHYRNPVDQPGAPMPISRRFPHRLAEVLIRLGPASGLATPKLREIVMEESRFIIGRQVDKGSTAPDERAVAALRSSLASACEAYLEELETLERPLSDYLGLFSLEAFINRQTDR